MSQVRMNKPVHTQAGAVKIVAVVVIVCLGLWGCARRPGAQNNVGERSKVLETRLQKIEQDYRTLSQARERARQDLAALEAENARLKKDLGVQTIIAREADKLRQQIKVVLGERDGLKSERDELRGQVSQRMNEREVLSNRCDKLRKGIQQLISQDDTTASANPGLTPTLPTATPVVNTQS